MFLLISWFLEKYVEDSGMRSVLGRSIPKLRAEELCEGSVGFLIENERDGMGWRGLSEDENEAKAKYKRGKME